MPANLVLDEVIAARARQTKLDRIRANWEGFQRSGVIVDDRALKEIAETYELFAALHSIFKPQLEVQREQQRLADLVARRGKYR